MDNVMFPQGKPEFKLRKVDIVIFYIITIRKKKKKKKMCVCVCGGLISLVKKSIYCNWHYYSTIRAL